MVCANQCPAFQQLRCLKPRKPPPKAELAPMVSIGQLKVGKPQPPFLTNSTFPSYPILFSTTTSTLAISNHMPKTWAQRQATSTLLSPTPPHTFDFSTCTPPQHTTLLSTGPSPPTPYPNWAHLPTKPSPTSGVLHLKALNLSYSSPTTPSSSRRTSPPPSAISAMNPRPACSGSMQSASTKPITTRRPSKWGACATSMPLPPTSSSS